MKQTFLYIMSSVGEYAVKIGISFDPENRLRQVQTCNHTKLRLAHAFPLSSKKAARRLEKLAHAKLDNVGLYGEWFFCAPDEAVGAIFEALLDGGMQ